MPDKKQENPAMLFALQLQGDGSALPLADQLTVASSERPQWLHGDRLGDDCQQWLQELGVPDSIIETLTRAESRPRVLSNERGILLILRVLNLNPGQDQEDMVSLRLWIEPHRIISIRQLRVFSVQDLREELLAGKGPASLQELIIDLIGRVIDRISVYVDGLEEVISSFDDKMELLDPGFARKEVSRIRRQAATIRRYLGPQREALDKFSHIPAINMDAYHLYLVQDLCDRTVRYVEDLDLVREQTQVLLEELINRVSQEQNARMYVLSIIAAIFLPISFITGMFGMNVGGLPGLDNNSGFFYVALLMAFISAGIILWFRSRKWL